MEVAIKVKENYCSFIPSEMKVREGDQTFVPYVSSYQDNSLLIEKNSNIHYYFSQEAAEGFYKGSE